MLYVVLSLWGKEVVRSTGLREAEASGAKRAEVLGRWKRLEAGGNNGRRAECLELHAEGIALPVDYAHFVEQVRQEPLEAVWAEWNKVSKCSVKSMEDREQFWGALRGFLGGKGVMVEQVFAEEFIAEFYAWKRLQLDKSAKAGSGVRTMNKLRGVMNQWGKWLLRKGYIEENLVPEVWGWGDYRADDGPDPLSNAEVVALLSVGKWLKLGNGLIDWFAVGSLLLSTGLRKGELLHLQWGDVELYQNGGRVRIRSKPWVGWVVKKGEERWVALGNNVADAMRQWQWKVQAVGGGGDEHWLMCSGSVPELRRLMDPRVQVKAWFKAAKVQWRGWHVFRHTFALRALEAGGAVDAIARAMGHKGVETTIKVYMRKRREMKEKERMLAQLVDI